MFHNNNISLEEHAAMTSNKQVVQQVAIVYGLLVFLGSRNQIGRTLW
jgi:hypothetical protein